jgi:hypothetical protein
MLHLFSIKSFFFLLYSCFWVSIWTYAFFLDGSTDDLETGIISINLPMAIFVAQFWTPLHSQHFLFNPLYDTDTLFNSKLTPEMLDEWLTIQQYEHKAIASPRGTQFWFNLIFNLDYAYLFIHAWPFYVLVVYILAFIFNFNIYFAEEDYELIFFFFYYSTS